MEEKKLLRKKTKAKQDNDEQQLAIGCNDLGAYYYEQGRYEDALAEFRQEVKVRKKMGQTLEMARAHRMLSEIYMLLSEFSEALSHVNIYLENAKALQNKIEEQRAYATLGRVHLLHGQSVVDFSVAIEPLKNAEKAFMKSLRVTKELSGRVSEKELLDMEARLYLNIGVVKEHMGEFDASISFLEKATKIAKNNDIYELLHQCFVSASLLYNSKKNDTSAALKFCNMALEVAGKLPNREKKECETLVNKSEIMIKVGDFQNAKQVLRKAYKINTPDVTLRQAIEKDLKIIAALCKTLDELVVLSSTDYKRRKVLYEKMGDGCCLLRNFDLAIEYYLKMLDCTEKSCESEKELIPVYVSLYQTYKDKGDYENSLTYLWKELELNKSDSKEACNTLCNIGEIYELLKKTFWTIKDIYAKAMEEARKANNTRLEKIVFARLIKLEDSHNMKTLLEELKDEIIARGFDLDELEESDIEDCNSLEQSTPNIGDDICLDDITDSENEGLTDKNAKPVRRKGSSLILKRNNKGETQLHQACISGDINLVNYLLDQGHAVIVRDHAGWLPLHEACNHGHREIVDLLLDRGALSAINDKGGTKCDGITPLYDACSNGNLDIVELLLERGANATLRTDSGDTCLNILEKWANTASLSSYDLSQYERIRNKIKEQMNRSGIVDNPLIHKVVSNSTDKLKTLAFGNESESSDDDELNYSNSSRRSIRCYRSSIAEKEDVGESSGYGTLSHESPNADVNYKSVIDGIKYPNRINSNNDNKHLSVKKRSAYLNDNEVGDDWLEDDIGPNKKKRKCLDSDFAYKSSYKSDRKSGSYEEYSKQAYANLMKDVESPNKCKTNVASSSSRRRLKRQSSLMDSGFCRFRGERSLSIESLETEHAVQPDSITPSVKSRTPSVESAENIDKASASVPHIPSTVPFKIKVEDELLYIPIDRKKLTEANILWLAQEVARRYNNISGLKPVLRLQTADGFAFEETDVISVALQEDIIYSKVLEWKIVAMSQRYVEICTQLHTDCDSIIKRVLEKAELSNCVQFSNFCLTSELVEPIFKAILHQSSINTLDLANNFLHDEGCKQLAKSLPTLKQLKFLNIQGNCITFEGLQFISTSLAALQVPLELESLYLSHNPLSNQSVRILEKICKDLPNLKELALSACGINNLYDFDLRFQDLVYFDISFNKLTLTSLKSLLKKLNACRINSLNLSFIAVEKRIGEEISEFLESGTCEKLKKLSVAGCNLVDSDIYKIAANLCKAKDMQDLDFSHNTSLTGICLQHILEKVPHIKRIYLDQCKNISKNFTFTFHDLKIDSENIFPKVVSLTVSDISEVDAFRNLWKNCYNEKARVIIKNNNIILSVEGYDWPEI